MHFEVGTEFKKPLQYSYQDEYVVDRLVSYKIIAKFSIPRKYADLIVDEIDEYDEEGDINIFVVCISVCFSNDDIESMHVKYHTKETLEIQLE